MDDLLAAEDARWERLQSDSSLRLAYAPVTEMTDEHIRTATRQMEAFRASALAANELTRDASMEEGDH